MRIAPIFIVLASSISITAFSQSDQSYYHDEIKPVEERIESLQNDLNDLNRYVGGEKIQVAGLEWNVLTFSDSLVSLGIKGSHDRKEILLFRFNSRKDLIRRIRIATGFVEHGLNKRMDPMTQMNPPPSNDWFRSEDTISFFYPHRKDPFNNEIIMKHVGHYAHKYQSDIEKDGQHFEKSYSLKYPIVLGSNQKHVFHLPVYQKPMD